MRITIILNFHFILGNTVGFHQENLGDDVFDSSNKEEVFILFLHLLLGALRETAETGF